MKNATVTNVVNGNTVVVTLGNGKQKRVRSGGVDAPDMKAKVGQLSERWISLVLNKRVNVYCMAVISRTRQSAAHLS